MKDLVHTQRRSWGKQRRGLRTKALMRVPKTRLECRHTVFARTEKTLRKFTFGENIDSRPAGLQLLPPHK